MVKNLQKYDVRRLQTPPTSQFLKIFPEFQRGGPKGLRGRVGFLSVSRVSWCGSFTIPSRL